MLERRQLQHVLADAMPQIRAAALANPSNPAAVHGLWGLPPPQAAPSDHVSCHHSAATAASPSTSDGAAAVDQQATSQAQPATANAAAAVPVFPAQLSAPSVHTAATSSLPSQPRPKPFSGVSQAPAPAVLMPQAYMPQVQPGLQLPLQADMTQLSALMHGCPSAVALVSDFEPVLRLAESLAKSNQQNQNVREFVSWLYSSMYRIYSDERSREHMLHSLVQRASSFDQAQPTTATATPTAAAKSKDSSSSSGAASSGSQAQVKDTSSTAAYRSTGAASPSGAVQGSQGKAGASMASSAQHRGAASGSPAAADVLAPAGLLLQLVHQHHDAAPTALALMLQQIQQQHSQVSCFPGLLLRTHTT